MIVRLGKCVSGEGSEARRAKHDTVRARRLCVRCAQQQTRCFRPAATRPYSGEEQRLQQDPFPHSCPSPQGLPVPLASVVGLTHSIWRPPSSPSPSQKLIVTPSLSPPPSPHADPPTGLSQYKKNPAGKYNIYTQTHFRTQLSSRLHTHNTPTPFYEFVNKASEIGACSPSP